MGTMNLMNKTGHESITWDVGDPESVRRARSMFDKYRRDGMLAFRSDRCDQASLITEFDPHAKTIYFSQMLVGG